MTRHRIISLTPATGWRAADLDDDGTLWLDDIAAWALVEVHNDPDDEPDHEVYPLLAPAGHYLDDIGILDGAPWRLIGPTAPEPSPALIAHELERRARSRERQEQRERDHQAPTLGPTAPPTPGAR